jgi:hypothetical protein
MRGYLIGGVLLVTVGCTQQQVSLQHASSLETRVRGVGMMSDGQSADVGMAGNTCRFDIGSSVIGADADVAQGEADVVHDGFGDRSIVVGASGVFVVDAGYGANTPVYPGSDIASGRFTEDGIALLHGDGQVRWLGGADEVAVVLPEGQQADERGFAVDRASGTAFVGTGAGAYAMSPSGMIDLGVVGDLVAFDNASGAVFVATEGGRELSALEVDGTPRWSLALDGVVTAMDDMGEGSAIAVMTDVDGAGQLLVVDGATGAVKMDQATPSAAPGISVSENGRSMAVILENEVHFFNVNL